jgi:hypothetical protein
MHGLWRAQILAIFAVLSVAAVGISVASVWSKVGPPLWFVVLWLLALVWNGYWFLVRIAYRLDLSDTELLWRTPLRNGAIELADLVEMRPYRLGLSIEVLQLADGSKVLVIVRKGFIDFTKEVNNAAPHVPVRVGAFAKIGDRLPGPRGFRRRG